MRNSYAGLFFTSFAALMLEILLTRIFSVATWYYFAFFAISVAMFGFTVGAIAVYLRKDLFTDDNLYRRMTLFSLLFGVSVDIALMTFLSIPFKPRFTGVGVFATVLTYLVISLPFVLSGVVVCLCLTRFPKKTALFYAADLVGAGIGAFMVFPVLNAMDAPTAVLLVGAIGALGGLFFAREITPAREGRYLKNAVTASFLVLTAIMMVNYVFMPVRVEWVKEKYRIPEVEAWNGFSRISVYPMNLVTKPYSWGLSPAYKPSYVIGERMLDMDGVSETVMTLFDGDFSQVEHLKYDVTAVAHYLRDNASVFVIGVGGGRDILASKAFGQKEVVGAEINNRTIEMVTEVFGDFTGHLDKLPGVTIINDEARSAITRMDKKFDIIQASCIATWSATTAGAFSLAENSLYTVEAWKIFMDRLKPDGILSLNRWYAPDYPAQLLRLSSLASQTLKLQGVKDPGRHIAIVSNPFMGKQMPSATILIGKSPFSENDIKRLRDMAAKLRFNIVFDPDGHQEPMFRDVIDNAGDASFHEKTLLDLTPSTDDKPFFFYMLRAKDLFSGAKNKVQEQRFNMEGINMLFVLMAVSVVLSIVFIFGPLLLKKDSRLPPAGAASGLFFFASIGFGYILIEIGLLQRLIIFLGHPTYSITVVIFSMLLSSGLGSLASSRWLKNGNPGPGIIAVVMAVLLGLAVFTIYVQPGILASYEMQPTFVRIIMSLVFLLPLGFIMGMPFPMGMQLASSTFKEHTPWFWAVNGATGVVSSVLSVCISITWGFTATLLTGAAFYVSAFVFLMALRQVAVRVGAR